MSFWGHSVHTCDFPKICCSQWCFLYYYDFYLCLTLSAEIMVWGGVFVHHPSFAMRRPASPFKICVAIISEPIKCISFKFQLQVALALNQGGKWHVWKTNHVFFFSFFVNFSFFLTLHPMGAKTSQCYSSLKSLLNIFKLFLNWNSLYPMGNQKLQLSGNERS